ncbi:hypothetical protein JM93_02297 [Roseibium hamelinense]|uniref:LPXTG-motif cell wall-anchored protein n=1 Tax=Roseibium hamelinense TaxID=150831 RepID=A0A562T2V7_9HYPH|nr:DUF6732 family protein [Roseibium hamelinense]MTI43855.1 hypothetical protein [Roseibium hamelinense]TWI87060.1 hypothetical protein JM93_02297 [Roseibium hamelinense]
MKIRTGLSGFLGGILVPTAAFAHAGHLGELAGHSHWIGVAALAGAVALAGALALKGRKKTAAEDETTADDTTPSERDAEAAQ